MRATSIAAGAHPIDPGAASLREVVQTRANHTSPHGCRRPLPPRQLLRPRPAGLLRALATGSGAGAEVALLQRAARRGARPRRRRAGRRRPAPRSSPATSVPEGAEPIAQAYAGHQFGGFSPQLGDGRAMLLGEVIDRAGRRRDIALQGLGPDAVLARRRRQGGGRADAARGPDRRGDARARHPDDARARGRRDRRAGAARDGAARRGADARRGEPHPRRHVPVLRRPRRRRARAPARRVHDRPPRRRSRRRAGPLPRACSSASPSARRR